MDRLVALVKRVLRGVGLALLLVALGLFWLSGFFFTTWGYGP